VNGTLRDFIDRANKDPAYAKVLDFLMDTEISEICTLGPPTPQIDKDEDKEAVSALRKRITGALQDSSGALIEKSAIEIMDSLKIKDAQSKANARYVLDLMIADESADGFGDLVKGGGAKRSQRYMLASMGPALQIYGRKLPEDGPAHIKRSDKVKAGGSKRTLVLS